MAFVLLTIVTVGFIQCGFFLSSLKKAFPRLYSHPFYRMLLKYGQVFPIILVVLSTIWFFFMVFLPVEAPELLSIRGLGYICIACYLWINTVFNYLAAMIRSPGYPDKKADLEEYGELDGNEEICHKCDCIREQGTHHCSTCQTCIQLMCHHCPLTGNCVGRDNYAYFILFLLYGTLGLILGSVMTYKPFMMCFIHISQHVSLYPMYLPGLCKSLGDYAIMFVIVMCLISFTGSMLLFHVCLLLWNLSTIEFFFFFHSLSKGLSNNILQLFNYKEKNKV